LVVVVLLIPVVEILWHWALQQSVVGMALVTAKLVVMEGQVVAVLEIDIQPPQADPALLVKEPMAARAAHQADKTVLVQEAAAAGLVPQEQPPVVIKQARVAMDWQVQYLVLV
jgi:hypothetical protein